MLYVSSATFTMNGVQLHELRQESHRNNAEHGVTGILFYIDRVFLQFIEGPNAAIDQLYSNVSRDDRNSAIVITLDRTVSQRAFPSWSMGFRSTASDGQVWAPGFHNMRDRRDLDAVKFHDASVFSLIRGLYLSNAGRSF